MAAPPKTRIYLASRSPRRRELLKQIGVAFEVLVLRDHPGRSVDVDESQQPGEVPDDYVRDRKSVVEGRGDERGGHHRSEQTNLGLEVLGVEAHCGRARQTQAASAVR